MIEMMGKRFLNQMDSLMDWPLVLLRVVESVHFLFYFHHSFFERSIRMSQINVLLFGEDTWLICHIICNFSEEDNYIHAEEVSWFY